MMTGQKISKESCGLCEVKWPCPFLLDNELALITGGGSGLGLAMARCLAAAGARVVLAGRGEDKLKQAVAGIGPRADYIPMTSPSSRRRPHWWRR